MSALVVQSDNLHVDLLSVPLQLPERRYGRRFRLQSLSPASIRTFEKCPEAFRRQYLLGEKVPPNLSMTLGSVVGDTLSHYFQGRIDGRPPAPAELDDLVLEFFAAKIVETVLGTRRRTGAWQGPVPLGGRRLSG